MNSVIRSAALAAALLAGLAPAAFAQKVKLDTTMGAIVLELDAQKAPKTVANFVQYVKDGHYSGTIFHRVIDGFMIQGGGMTADMKEKTTRPPIPLEVGKGMSNSRGTIAMARTNVRDSATDQFFINVVDNPNLDTNGGGYAVFGKVVEGMDVVDRIRAVETGDKAGHQNVPKAPVTIKSATLEK